MAEGVNTRAMHERLWRAAERGDAQTIRYLFIEGVNLDAPNDDGFTAFNLATQNGHHDVAMVILAAREMQFAQGTGENPGTFFGIEGGVKKSGRKPGRKTA